MSRLAKVLCIALASAIAVAVIVRSTTAFRAHCLFQASQRESDPPRARLALIEQALRLAPGATDAHRAAARQCIRIALDEPDQAEPMLAAAERHLLAAVRAEPTHPGNHYALGCLYTVSGQQELADEEFDATLKLDPCNADFFEHIGRIHLQRRKNRRWVDELRRAIALDNPRAVPILQDVWAASRDPVELRFMAGDSWPLRLASLEILQNQGHRQAAARECLAMCREAKEAPEEVKERLAAFLTGSREYLLALSFLERWLKDTPSSFVLRREMAAALRSARDTDTALELTRTLLQEKPNDAATHAILADVYAGRGNSGAAETEYLKAIEIAPTSFQYHRRLLDFYMNSMRYTKAVEAGRKAVALFPNEPAAYFALGNAQAAAKDLPAALCSYREAQRLRPDNPAYSQAVEEARQRLGSGK